MIRQAILHQSYPALRVDEVWSWLEPLAAALALRVALLDAAGSLLRGEAPTDECLRADLTLNGVCVATLAADAEQGALAALAAAIEAQLESRHAIGDLAQSLARAWMEANFMYDLTRHLREAFDVPTAALTVVQQLCRVTRAGRVALYLGTDPPVLVANAPYGPPDTDEARTAAAATAGGEPIVAGDPATCLGVPLKDAAAPIGALVVTGDPRVLSAPNMKFLAGVSQQVVQALQMRILVEQAIKAAEMHREVELAAEIQRALLPRRMPAVPGLAIAARSVPAQHVGGDGYDFHARGVDLDVLIADASGHGVGPGLLLSGFFSYVAAIADDALDPAAIVGRVNRHVEQAIGTDGHYLTGLYLRFHGARRELEWSSMGHYPPLLWRDGSVTALPAVAGLPAGMAEDGGYATETLALHPGDVVLAFTDGLLEARAPDGSLFGVDGLREALHAAAAPGVPPEAILAGIFAACAAHGAGAPQDDDQTAVVLRVELDR